MPNLSINRYWLILVLLGCVGTGDLAAQSGCSYDQCALRVRHRPFLGADVVQGQRGDKIGGYSFFGFAPQLPMLAESTDSVRVHYEAFRAGTNSGAILEIIGGAAMLGALIALDANGGDELSIGLVAGALVPLVWGTIRQVQARDRLSRAIWWYNGTLR